MSFFGWNPKIYLYNKSHYPTKKELPPQQQVIHYQQIPNQIERANERKIKRERDTERNIKRERDKEGEER